MEQIKNKSLLLAGVITLAASMFAGCMEEVPPRNGKVRADYHQLR